MSHLFQHVCMLPACSSPHTAGLQETLAKSYDTLEAIQKSLEEYLETKRVAFPRFYFLSNDGERPHMLHHCRLLSKSKKQACMQ
jgi:hypothetical protein